MISQLLVAMFTRVCLHVRQVQAPTRVAKERVPHGSAFSRTLPFWVPMLRHPQVSNMYLISYMLYFILVFFSLSFCS